MCTCTCTCTCMYGGSGKGKVWKEIGMSVFVGNMWIDTFFVQQRYGMVTPISLEWAGSSGMMSLIIIVSSGVRKRTIMTVLV